jgi:hypothetical protein
MNIELIQGDITARAGDRGARNSQEFASFVAPHVI